MLRASLRRPVSSAIIAASSRLTSIGQHIRANSTMTSSIEDALAIASKAAASSSSPDSFQRTPSPAFSEGKYVSTAACLIIGDEVLNGKTRDSNSNFMAKTLFDLGIELKRIEVIADDEDEIIEAARRLTDKYDMVVTSGGIGPTHDDITYASIAKAFDSPEGELVYNEDTINRMYALSKRRPDQAEQTDEQKKARLRMALFPVKHAEVLHVDSALWVPVVRMQQKLCILPGVPRLFEVLLTSYVANYVPLPPSSSKPFRVLVHTEMPESSIAPFLTELQARVKSEGIRVGSYPKLRQGVDVSLIGQDNARLQELAQECCKELSGQLIAQGKLGEEN